VINKHFDTWYCMCMFLSHVGALNWSSKCQRVNVEEFSGFHLLKAVIFVCFLPHLISCLLFCFLKTSDLYESGAAMISLHKEYHF